jgi:glycerol kinase
VPEVAETTALGAAYLAGVGIGAWTIDQLRSADREKDRYEPEIESDERERLLHGWARALERARGWAEA